MPAGTFSTDVFVVRIEGGGEGRFHVERRYPHRIVRRAWKATTTAPSLGTVETAELTGSTRLAYWRTHDPGDETYLQRLGFEPVVR